MKKLLAILMCLMMLCVGAYAEDAAVDYTGEWKLDSIEAMGMTISPSMMGLEMSITLNADGTAVLRSNEDVEETTWTVNENYVVVGNMNMVEADGKLLAEEASMGATMYFVRAGEEAVPVLPEVKTDAALADFNGKWTLTTLSMMGMEMPAAMMGMGLDLEILDGAVVATFSEQAEDGTMMSVPYEVTGTFADGKLSVTVEETEMVMDLQLKADGTMFFEVEEEGMVGSFNFEKAE